MILKEKVLVEEHNLYDCQRTRKVRNALHEQFARQTAPDVGREDPWICLKNAYRRLDTRCSRTRFENRLDPAKHITHLRNHCRSCGD